MHQSRPWVVAGARGAIVVLMASALSAAAVHRENSAPGTRRAVMEAPDQPSGAVVFAVLAAVTSEPAPPPRPAPPPPPPPIVWPGTGAVSGWFGEGRATHRHKGLDLRAATGAPVVAAAAGTILHAGPAPSGYGGYGTIVLIEHGGGVVTMYAHLSRVNVRRGQVAAPGDLVGGAGSTGQVTSPHLHFEVRRNGVSTDPQRWLPPRQGPAR